MFGFGTCSEVDFKYQDQVEDLFETVMDSDCGYSPAIGRRQIMRSVPGYAIYNNAPEAIEILKRLHAAGKTRSALGYSWDGTQCDSE